MKMVLLYEGVYERAPLLVLRTYCRQFFARLHSPSLVIGIFLNQVSDVRTGMSKNLLSSPASRNAASLELSFFLQSIFLSLCEPDFRQICQMGYLKCNTPKMIVMSCSVSTFANY